MIIFFYGEDTFRAQEKIEEVKAKFVREVDPTGNGITSVDSQDSVIDDIARLMASGGGFFSVKRLIILKNPFHAKKAWKDALCELIPAYIAETGSDSNILLIWQASAVDKREALWNRLKNAPFKQEWVLLQGGLLSQWIKKRFEQYGMECDHDAQMLLEACVGSDLWHMNHEIEKVSAYAMAQGRSHSISDDVKQLVEARFNDDIFGLMDAVSNKQHQQAVSLLNDQWASGADSLYILSMLIRQFRILALVKHKSDITPASARSLAQELSLHPFVVEKAIKQSKNFSWHRLVEAYHALVHVDEAVKTTSSKGEEMVSYCIAKVLLSS
ncbi:MAG TPA: DNA polymerase III subunit delta [Patescibacteria group bacterium]|nr:DNA polymerase III subunit delta [Patescibacteria group bacterium]